MKKKFRQSMASLHTWAGLLPGWLLFVIFLFGTVAFFQDEISLWMRPELASQQGSAEALDAVSRRIASEPAITNWSLSLPSKRGGPMTLFWSQNERGVKQRRHLTFVPSTGSEVQVRDTQGGGFLYSMHFNLHYMPTTLARYIICVASLAMLLTILSGIVTHKKIFADFFLLRFGKGQRSWLDAHNVTAVLALPFHLMITYTGLAALLFTLMPWAINANFPNRSAFVEAALPAAPKIEPSGKSLPLLPLRELVERAERIQGDAKPSYITISNAGDASSVVGLFAAADKLGGYRPPLYLNGATGAQVRDVPSVGGARATQRTMIDLHAGRFAGPALRWLYFLSGVGGTVMIATGLVLWTVKRRAKLPDPMSPHLGFCLVERLNIGVIAGASAGIAVYFLANRLLPLGTAHRADWEINSLFIAWGGLSIWTLARPAKRAWTEALAACALLYAAVPIVSAVTTTRGLIPSLAARDWVFAGFDLTMLATAAAFAVTARKVATHKPGAKASARREAMRERAEAAT